MKWCADESRAELLSRLVFAVCHPQSCGRADGCQASCTSVDRVMVCLRLPGSLAVGNVHAAPTGRGRRMAYLD